MTSVQLQQCNNLEACKGHRLWSYYVTPFSKGSYVDYGENYLLHKTPSTMNVMKPWKRKSIFAFATSANKTSDTIEADINCKKNNKKDQGTSMQKEEVTTDSSSDTVPLVKESKRPMKKK